MEKIQPPYIGVTGFMSAEDVNEVLKVVPAKTERKIMVGVLVSSKTMRGIPNKWPNRYPNVGKIAEIFPDNPVALNLVHFNTKDPDQLLAHMLEVTELSGKNFHGFQLNIKWPNPDAILEYKDKHPDKIIVLQCGEAALNEVHYDPAMLTLAAANYEHSCDYLLIDPSGGLGKKFNPLKGLDYLKHLNANLKKMRFGIAGGLSSDNIADMMYLIAEKFPNTSIDAEGNLRDENDYLDVAKAKKFVSEAYNFFSKYEK